MTIAMPKIPIALLTGFLGSGKTTLLKAILASPEMAGTAVIINEAGDASLDHLLVETVDEAIYALPSGCLCCVRRLDIVTTVRSLLERLDAGTIQPFERIVIETSGLADPAPILYTLAVDPMLGHRLAFSAVVTLVDAVAGEASLERHPEAAAQVAVADRLLLSKTDLQPPSEELLARLAVLNPWAPQIALPSHGALARLLFDDGLAGFLEHMPASPPKPAHSFGIETFSITLRSAPTRLAFATALGRFASERGEDLLRVKGLVEFADRPGFVGVMHAVQHTLYRPQWLDRWPDEDERSRFVFIVRNIGLDEILARFAFADPKPWQPLPPGFVCDAPPVPFASHSALHGDA